MLHVIQVYWILFEQISCVFELSNDLQWSANEQDSDFLFHTSIIPIHSPRSNGISLVRETNPEQIFGATRD